MKKSCPECFRELKNGICPKCGYKENNTNSQFAFQFPKFKIRKINFKKFFGDTNEQNVKGITFKKGIRRFLFLIVFIFTVGGVINSLFNGYVFSGKNIFLSKVKIDNKLLNEFLIDNHITDNNEERVYYWDFDCYPYLQKCICKKELKTKELVANKIIKVYDKVTGKIEKECKIEMPTRIRYFFSQISDVFIIIVLAILTYLLYLLFEFIISWILAGFNINLSNIKLPKLKFDKNMSIVLIVLILAGAYIYVEHSKITYKEKLRQEEQNKIEANQKAYEACVADADANYNYNWNRACQHLGKKNDCALPSYNADTIDKWHKEAKTECMNKFKNNAFME